MYYKGTLHIRRETIMSFNLSINFNGNCREAVAFYAKVFGQEEPYILTYAEGDASFDPNFIVSEKMKDWVMFTQLEISGTIFEFSDMPDTFEFIRGNSMHLTLTFTDIEEAKNIFSHLSENGQVAVPFSEISGQGFYGMLGDQFGIGWIVKA